jgi:hypothetical protein
MSGLNLITTQDSISDYIRAQFPNYTVYDDMILDDDFIVKQGNSVKPYIVLEYGGLRNSATAGSFVGVRHDEYYSTVDVSVVAPTPKQARRSLNVIEDSLIGWKPADSTPLVPEGGMDVLGIPNMSGSIVVYLASIRLRYGINTTGIGAHIAH